MELIDESSISHILIRNLYLSRILLINQSNNASIPIIKSLLKHFLLFKFNRKYRRFLYVKVFIIQLLFHLKKYYRYSRECRLQSTIYLFCDWRMKISTFERIINGYFANTIRTWNEIKMICYWMMKFEKSLNNIMQ